MPVRPESPVQQKSSLQAAAESLTSVFSPKAEDEEEKKEKDRPSRFSLGSAVNLIPRIQRGFLDEEGKDDTVVVGWKADVRSRKEREEVLRDEVHRFEGQLKGFVHTLEEGIDVMMWQLNKFEDKETPHEFPLKASHVTVKYQRKGDMLVQSSINFILRGGYLSKTIGRNRNVNKTALEPLSLHDVLSVKAGCSGFDHTELPTATGRTKSKAKGGKSENRQSSLFVTITATPTPMAASRSYILRFKSRSARNDLLNGLRSVLADMQIHEGVSVSGLQSSNDVDYEEEDDVMVPLGAIHKVLNREREAYDRILLMMLQGTEDLKEKEDELLTLRKKLDSVIEESAEKDRVQANDSKLIMQLSKKLETLLMDNEDLRDQNDRLNSRLIAAECEKMNMMS